MELLALILVCLLLAALILPWVNLAKHANRKAEIRQLQEELARLKSKTETRRPEVLKPEAQKTETLATGTVGGDVPPPIPKVAKVTKVASELKQVEGCAPSQPPEPEPSESLQPKSLAAADRADEPSGAAHDWFSKIAVWVGGVALLMAGFFMIKYSIDSGWLTPAVRLWMTTVFGGLLCAGGFVVSLKTTIRANDRVGQALSGAGVACLYFAVYAAVHLYQFLDRAEGFGCMVAVTVLAVLLSLRNGAPIALMGLVGGFLTPLLMQSESADTALLFGYLFLLLCAAQVLCLRRGWWGLLLGSQVGAYLWSGAIIWGNAVDRLHDLEGAMLFVLGVCGANALLVVLASGRELESDAKAFFKSLRVIAWAGGLAQSLVLVCMGDFAAVDMALFAVLALGALVLAVLREEEFVWAAPLGLLAVAVAAGLNAEVALASWFLSPVGLALVFAGVAHWRGLRSAQSELWRVVSMSALLGLAPVLYVNRELIAMLPVAWDAFWLVLAVGAAGLLALAGEHLLRRGEGEAAGLYQGLAVLLLAFGLWEYVALAYLPHWAAALWIGSALYWQRRRLEGGGLVLVVLAGAWTLLMLEVAGEAFAYYFGEIYKPGVRQDGVAVLAWLAGVAGAFGVMRLYWADWTERTRGRVAWWAGAVTVLGLVALYQWIDESLLKKAYIRAWMEGGLTAVFALLALGVRWVGPRWSARPLVAAVLAVLVVPRLFYLHLFGVGASGETFFFNPVLLQFGLPFVVASALAWRSASDDAPALRQAYQIAAMILGFVWSCYLVRDYFGAAELFGRGSIASTELYTYSVVWLLLAIGYQAIGLLRDQKLIHVGSLVLLLLTVGKVFLVDASELEGLFRVLSFLGLGFTLIGIGFFYNKVVFGRRQLSASRGSEPE